MYKACLFDMDGLLINSEDIYTEVTNEILAEHGKGPLPWSVKIQLQGRPGPDASKKFLEWSKLPYTPEQYFALTSEKQKTKWNKTQFLPGAKELLAELKQKGIPFALATSSHRKNFELKTAHLDEIFALFGDHIVVGDDPRIPAGRGKPHPDIWLVALESLNSERRSAQLPEIAATECLVFEDGVPGVEAGLAAGARVIWVPHVEALKVLNGQEHEILPEGKGAILPSLLEFDLNKYVQ